MKAKIYMNDCSKPIVFGNDDISFEEFVKELFKGRIYLSHGNKDSKPIAINTDQINYIWGNKE